MLPRFKIGDKVVLTKKRFKQEKRYGANDYEFAIYGKYFLITENHVKSIDGKKINNFRTECLEFYNKKYFKQINYKFLTD